MSRLHLVPPGSNVCNWQTEYGTAGSPKYCSKPAGRDGMCAGHRRDWRELYPHLPLPKFMSRSDVRRIYTFDVEVYDPEADDFDLVGSVLLPDHALRHEVEHALAAVGVYCPRGADELTWEVASGARVTVRDGFLSWDAPSDDPIGLIHDGDGRILVRMYGRTS